jgi:NAD(P)-dependent dehydrogenase (short-subunit alcohol dehydrogenase family)
MSVVSDMERKAVRAKAFKADQADPAKVAALVADVHRDFGRLDILVANAGVFAAAPIDANDTVALGRMHAINVIGVIAAHTSGLAVHRRWRAYHCNVVGLSNAGRRCGIGRLRVHQSGGGRLY